MSFKIKIPQIHNLLLVYFFTSSIWRALLFDHILFGWILNPLIILFLLVLTIIKQKRRWREFLDIPLLYIFILVLFLLKFVGNGEMSEWVTRTYGLRHMISWGWIFAYAVIRVQPNLYDMLNCLKKIGIVLFIYCAYQSIEVLTTGYWTYEQFGITRVSTGNMSWSYTVLTAVCFTSIYIFKDKKKWPIIPISVGMVGVLIYGSRGTMIGFVLGILLMILFLHRGKMTFRNYLVLFIFAGMLFFVLSDTGILMISDILAKYGVESRLIDTLSNFTSFEDSSNGRALIWTTVASLITKGPFYGYGVYGERNVIYALGMKWGYAHNIFLELLVAFGWLFGTIIIVWLILGMIRFLISTHNKDEKILFILFLTISFELILSNSLWLHCGLWALMGIAVNHFNNKKYGNEEYGIDLDN